jgi:hypothetical protein
MAYYGIADYASGFSRGRNNDLMSGQKALDEFADTYKNLYRVPEEMATSDARRLSSQIQADTLSRNYGSAVRAGGNRIRSAELGSGIDLQQLSARDDMNRLRAEAIKAGIRNPLDQAKFMAEHMDPARAAQNPYLRSHLDDYHRQQALHAASIGATFGGTLGVKELNNGLSGMGYDYQAKHENGATILTDPATGLTSNPFTAPGMIYSLGALNGNPGPVAQYFSRVEDHQFANQRARDAASAYAYGKQATAQAAQDRVEAQNLRTQYNRLMIHYDRLLKSGDHLGADQVKTQIDAIVAQMGGGARDGTGGPPYAGASPTGDHVLDWLLGGQNADEAPPAPPASPRAPVTPGAPAPSEKPKQEAPPQPLSPMDALARQIAPLEQKFDALKSQKEQVERDYASVTSVRLRGQFTPEEVRKIKARRDDLIAQLTALRSQIEGLHTQGRTASMNAPGQAPQAVQDIRNRY